MPSHSDPFALPTANTQSPKDTEAIDQTVKADTTYQVIGITNRLRAVLLHVPHYSFEGTARLARDTGLAPSSISRIIRGKVSPSYVAVEIITKAISSHIGRQLDARELFTTDGTYPTPSTCELMECSGCLPPEAWCECSDTLRPRWKRQKPGGWCQFSKPEAISVSQDTEQDIEDTQKPESGPA